MCSRLSGEAPWVACSPVGEGPLDCDVVPHPPAPMKEITSGSSMKEFVAGLFGMTTTALQQ